jgi:hypothetical protein
LSELPKIARIAKIAKIEPHISSGGSFELSVVSTCILAILAIVAMI